MLQQTQVATVLPYYGASSPSCRWSPISLRLRSGAYSNFGAASVYYRRAHYLHESARIVVRDHGGRFPVDAATLMMLPGIGRSTANAIAAFASGERGAILDGNVKRGAGAPPRHRGVAG
jgi:A/G-specific adenine glycosylase